MPSRSFEIEITALFPRDKILATQRNIAPIFDAKQTSEISQLAIRYSYQWVPPPQTTIHHTNDYSLA
jgi:hypothetical protein